MSAATIIFGSYATMIQTFSLINSYYKHENDKEKNHENDKENLEI